MKKSLFTITCFLWGLLSFTSQAQIISVTSGTDFNIMAATVISADSMDLVPAADFTINGSSLVKSNVVNNSTGIPHINRVYQFSTATNAFSGALKMFYNNAEVNGLTETSLKLLIHNGSSWSLDNNSSVNTTNKFVQNNSVGGVSLGEITAGACSPNTGDTSASACVSFVWYGNTYTSSATPTHTFTNVRGCDSVVTLHLTINATPSTPTVNVVNNCNGTSTLSTTASGTLLWNTTETTSPITVSSAGTYTVTQTVNGCVSGSGSGLAAPKAGSTSTATIAAIGSYTWNGTTYYNNGTYTYQSTNSNGCDSIATLYLTIGINNIKNVCTYIGTNQTLTYTASVASASSYAWTLPANTQLVSGQGTRSIVIRLLNGFASQANKQIRVTPAGGSLQIIYLSANAPITPATITASTASVCASIGTNVPVVFKISKVYESVSNGTTVSSYLWSAQNGTTTISHVNGTGENDTTVSVTFAPNFSTSTITVQSVNTCGVSGIRSYLITRNNPTVGIISGPTNSCEYIGSTGTVATYSAPAVTNINSYSWTLPIGATNVIGQGTNTVTFKYPVGYTGGSISVTGTNGCGTSSVRTLSISRLLPGTPGNIDIINTQVCPNREYSYSLASIPGNATSLLWAVPTRATILGGQGTRSITVSYSSGVVDGIVTVKAVSNCGTSSSSRSSIVKLAPCPVGPGTSYTKAVTRMMPTAMDVKVFPNPTTSSFNLQVTVGGSKSAIQARVLDLQGRMMKVIQINLNENISLGAEFKPGVYMLEVLQGTEKKLVRMVKY